MTTPGLLTDLVITIVLYDRALSQSPAFASLQASLELPDVFVYDNSPHATGVAHPTVTYMHDPENAGVSCAYNAAARYADEKGKKWMLFLDQDTAVIPDLFSSLEKATQIHPHSVAFVPRINDARGLLSPFMFSCGRGKRISQADEKLPLDKFRFINSGLLIRHSAFVDAGGYDETIPLDFSDIYFGERLRKVTNHFIVVDSVLQHSFSDNEIIPVETALNRFAYFCKGAIVMGKRSGNRLLYSFNTFIRACHLCFRYKDLRFLTRYLHLITHG